MANTWVDALDLRPDTMDDLSDVDAVPTEFEAVEAALAQEWLWEAVGQME